MLVQTLRERMLLARHTPEDENTTVQHHLTPLIKNKTYFPNLGVKFPQNAAKRKINYIYIINIQGTALYFEARVAVALFRKSFQVGMMRRNCCSESYSCCHCSQNSQKLREFGPLECQRGGGDDSTTLVEMLTHSSRRSRVRSVPHGCRRTDNRVKIPLMCFESSVTSEGILVPDPDWKMQTKQLHDTDARATERICSPLPRISESKLPIQVTRC